MGLLLVSKRSILSHDEPRRLSGYLRQYRPTGSARPTLLVWNANSHADRHGHGCPFAPAMQHSGGADLTAALYR